MEWAYLFLAILMEVVGTTSLKLSEGFSRTWPTATCVMAYLIAIAALGQSLKKLDISLTYAIWSGLGTFLVAIIGIVYFKEPSSLLKIVSIGLVITGLVGLQLSRT